MSDTAHNDNENVVVFGKTEMSMLEVRRSNNISCMGMCVRVK